MLSTYQVPFLLHLLVETPACLNFLLRPGNQLEIDQPYAHAVIRQYAVLLFSTNLVALIFVLEEPSQLSAKVAGAFAVYHIAPIFRAAARLQSRPSPSKGKSEPLLHLTVHVTCLIALASVYLCT